MSSVTMSPIKILSVILFASSCCNAATAQLDPSKYTVTFEFSDGSSCLGAILSDSHAISAVECFGERSGEAFNFTWVKAVVGGRVVAVSSVTLPKFPQSEDRVLRDYALVAFKEELRLEENDLVALKFPSHNAKINSWGLVSKDDGNGLANYTIVDSKNCPNSIPVSHLCVELPNPDDRCLDKRGRPMVVQTSDRQIFVIGLYVGCYDDSAHEIFANAFSRTGKSSVYFLPHVYP